MIQIINYNFASIDYLHSFNEFYISIITIIYYYLLLSIILSSTDKLCWFKKLSMKKYRKSKKITFEWMMSLNWFLTTF
jgi:hypothetical protein